MIQDTISAQFIEVETAAGVEIINPAQVARVSKFQTVTDCGAPGCGRTHDRHATNGVKIHFHNGEVLEILGIHAAGFEIALSPFIVSRVTAPAQLTAVPMPGRKPYCQTPDASRREYLDNQGVMFSACAHAGLDTEQREEMIAAINQRFDLNITSRTQLTPQEMRAVAHAADRGEFLPGWHLTCDRESLAA